MAWHTVRRGRIALWLAAIGGVVSSSSARTVKQHGGAVTWRSSVGHSTAFNLSYIQGLKPALRRTAVRGRGLLQAVDVGSLWSDYLSVLEAYPLPTKAVTAGVILPAGDYLAQVLERSRKQEGEKKPVDLARTLRFAIFGVVLQAPFNHAWYLILDGLLPPPPEPLSITNVQKVALDQFLEAPVFTALIFAFLGLLEGKSFDGIRKQLKNDYGPTMISNWKVWIPASFLNLAFFPPELRVLFTNVVFFGWSCFLSLVINSDSSAAEAKEATD